MSGAGARASIADAPNEPLERPDVIKACADLFDLLGLTQHDVRSFTVGRHQVTVHLNLHVETANRTGRRGSVVYAFGSSTLRIPIKRPVPAVDE